MHFYSDLAFLVCLEWTSGLKRSLTSSLAGENLGSPGGGGVQIPFTCVTYAAVLQSKVLFDRHESFYAGLLVLDHVSNFPRAFLPWFSLSHFGYNITFLSKAWPIELSSWDVVHYSPMDKALIIIAYHAPGWGSVNLPFVSTSPAETRPRFSRRERWIFNNHGVILTVIHWLEPTFFTVVIRTHASNLEWGTC